jgi:hypothetical protein
MLPSTPETAGVSDEIPTNLPPDRIPVFRVSLHFDLESFNRENRIAVSRRVMTIKPW